MGSSPGALVVMRVGNEPGTHPQQGEGFYLQVSGGGIVDVGLVHGDVTVVLLVHVQVLDESLLHEVLQNERINERVNN